MGKWQTLDYTVQMQLLKRGGVKERRKVTADQAETRMKTLRDKAKSDKEKNIAEAAARKRQADAAAAAKAAAKPPGAGTLGTTTNAGTRKQRKRSGSRTRAAGEQPEGADEDPAGDNAGPTANAGDDRRGGQLPTMNAWQPPSELTHRRLIF